MQSPKEKTFINKSLEEKLQEIELRYQIERSKNELFEATHAFTQKEEANMREKLISLAVKLDKEAEALVKRKLDLDLEAEARSQSRIEQISSHYLEKQAKLLESLSQTDEKALKHELLVSSLEERLLNLTVQSKKNSLLNEEKDSSTLKNMLSIENKAILNQKALEEAQKAFESLTKTHSSCQNNVENLLKKVETLENDKNRLIFENKEQKGRLYSLQSLLDQKGNLLESLEAERKVHVKELQQAFLLEKEELLEKLALFERNERGLKRNPSQSQAFSPLPKEFESKFDFNNDFKLEGTPKNRYSLHIKGEKSLNSELVREKPDIKEVSFFEKTPFSERTPFGKDLYRENQSLLEERRKLIEEVGFNRRVLESLREAKGEIQRQFEKLALDFSRIRGENNQKDQKLLLLMREVATLKKSLIQRDETIESFKKSLLEKEEILGKGINEKKGFLEEIETLKETIKGLNEEIEGYLKKLEGFIKENKDLQLRITEEITPKSTNNEENKALLSKIKLLEDKVTLLLKETSSLIKAQELLQNKIKHLSFENTHLTIKLKEIPDKAFTNKELLLKDLQEEFLIKLKEKDAEIDKLKGLNKEPLLKKVIFLEQSLLQRNKELEILKTKLISLEKSKIGLLGLQKDLNEKTNLILAQNKEIIALNERNKLLEAHKMRSFSKEAIFIDDPNIKDLEIKGLKHLLREKQLEIDNLKEKGCIVTPKSEKNPILLVKALQKKDLEIKALHSKNADLWLNLQNALNKLNDFLNKPHYPQNTTTNVIVNNGTRGKSDGLVFDRNYHKLLSENDRMKEDIPKLEHLLLKTRLGAVEERASLQNEIKLIEEKNVEFKVKLAQMAFDKDYYMIKYQGIVKDLERFNGGKKE